MRNKSLIILGIISFSLLFSGCCIKHEYLPATCEAPMTCAKCGKTEGSPLEHSWTEATCEDPRTCIVCGTTEGEAIGHNWVKASCMYPQSCTNCGITVGEPAEHNWIQASCIQPKHCAVCGATEGGVVDHVWKAASYSSPRTCVVCGATEGEALKPYSYPGQGSQGGQGFTFNLGLGTESEYKTITGYNNSIAEGNVTVESFTKYTSDAAHAAKEGYEWREIKVKFSMDRPCRVMWGYTDGYAGLSDYAMSDYITMPDGSRQQVVSTQSFSTEVAKPSVTPTAGVTPTPEPTQEPTPQPTANPSNPVTPTPTPSPTPTPTPSPVPTSEPGKYISYVTKSIQVPTSYKGLVFYVCNADYELTHRVDDSFQFFSMD